MPTRSAHGSPLQRNVSTRYVHSAPLFLSAPRRLVQCRAKLTNQAEEDVRENDVEAAYVNYIKAVSIVVEVIPRHKGMKELEEKRTVQAQEYWIFRNVQSILSKLQMTTGADTKFSAYPL